MQCSLCTKQQCAMLIMTRNLILWQGTYIYSKTSNLYCFVKGSAEVEVSHLGLHRLKDSKLEQTIESFTSRLVSFVNIDLFLALFLNCDLDLILKPLVELLYFFEGIQGQKRALRILYFKGYVKHALVECFGCVYQQFEHVLSCLRALNLIHLRSNCKAQ